MAKKAKKPTNKQKYSIYLDRDIMKAVSKEADKIDRSTNYVIEKQLAEKFN